MSIFDKDLVQKPVRIPKEEAVKYTLDWITQKSYDYLSNRRNEYWEHTNASTREFCKEYIRRQYHDFLRGIQWGNGTTTVLGSQAIEYPEECIEYPKILSYDVTVTYDTHQSSLKNEVLYTIYVMYRESGSLTYHNYKAVILI